jgi:tRNA nucleotidyltransferase (CCA-adding enzyme)
MMARAQQEAITRAISHYFHRYRHVSTEIRGKDLKALGVPPGRIYKTMLDELLSARLDGEVRNRQEELSYLEGRYPELFEQSQSEVVTSEAAPPGIGPETCEGAKN